VAELMLAANNFTSSYAKALLAATRKATWRVPTNPRKSAG
jgi:hypothetical protein